MDSDDDDAGTFLTDSLVDDDGDLALLQGDDEDYDVAPSDDQNSHPSEGADEPLREANEWEKDSPLHASIDIAEERADRFDTHNKQYLKHLDGDSAHEWHILRNKQQHFGAWLFYVVNEKSSRFKQEAELVERATKMATVERRAHRTLLMEVIFAHWRLLTDRPACRKHNRRVADGAAFYFAQTVDVQLRFGPSHADDVLLVDEMVEAPPDLLALKHDADRAAAHEAARPAPLDPFPATPGFALPAVPGAEKPKRKKRKKRKKRRAGGASSAGGASARLGPGSDLQSYAPETSWVGDDDVVYREAQMQEIFSIHESIARRRSASMKGGPLRCVASSAWRGNKGKPAVPELETYEPLASSIGPSCLSVGPGGGLSTVLSPGGGGGGGGTLRSERGGGSSRARPPVGLDSASLVSSLGELGADETLGRARKFVENRAPARPTGGPSATGEPAKQLRAHRTLRPAFEIERSKQKRHGDALSYGQSSHRRRSQMGAVFG